uniref:Metal transporter Nramp5-like n=1 Tax=Rhizophora mucronata TaxID=61149 RepID=A0A2P2MRX9_RHIMU
MPLLCPASFDVVGIIASFPCCCCCLFSISLCLYLSVCPSCVRLCMIVCTLGCGARIF